MNAPVPDYPGSLEAEVRTLARRVADAGMAVTPTLVTFGTIADCTSERIHDLLARDELRFVDPLTRKSWEPDFNRFRQGGWSARLGFMARVLGESHRLQRRLVGAFQDAGGHAADRDRLAVHPWWCRAPRSTTSSRRSSPAGSRRTRPCGRPR